MTDGDRQRRIRLQSILDDLKRTERELQKQAEIIRQDIVLLEEELNG